MWIWGCKYEGCILKVSMKESVFGIVECKYEILGKYIFVVDVNFENEMMLELFFIENEINIMVGYNLL